MTEARRLFDEFVAGGEALLEQAKTDQREETLYLDFKQGGERNKQTQTGSGKMSPDDRNNLAKAISGFANSEGGVVIWGVDCREGKGDDPDVVQALVPILNVRRFLTDLQSCTNTVVSGAQGVLHKHLDSAANPGSGYVITYVPAGEGAPVMALAKDMNCYWYRSGSSFRRMEAFMVADRFARRSYPKLAVSFSGGGSSAKIKPLRPENGYAFASLKQGLASVSLGIRNTGSAASKNARVSLEFLEGCYLDPQAIPKTYLGSGPRYSLHGAQYNFETVYHNKQESLLQLPFLIVEMNSTYSIKWSVIDEVMTGEESGTLELEVSQ